MPDEWKEINDPTSPISKKPNAGLYKYHSRFYCPSCLEELIIHHDTEMEGDDIDCPCGCIMLKSER